MWLLWQRKTLRVKKKTKTMWLQFAVQLYNMNSFESRVLWWFGYALWFKRRTPEPHWALKRARRNQKAEKIGKLLSSCMLPLDQHSQLKAELGKHLLSGAIFLMLISLIARAMWGDICIRSIRLTLGASRMVFGGETAYWIAQMARGRMYTTDL